MKRSRLSKGSSKIRSSRLSSFSASTVLGQLGGNKFIAMTGAKDFMKDDDKRMIAFKIGRNSKTVNYVKITLNGKDLYDMDFIRIRGANMKVVSTAKDVYFDKLQGMFTEHTGMYTHL